MREVNGQAMDLILRICEASEIGRDEVLAAFSIGKKIPKRMDWDPFVRGMRWFEERIGGAALLEDSAARYFVDVPSHRDQIASVRLFGSPRMFYWAMHRWGGHSLFNNVTTQLEYLGPTSLRFRITADRPAPQSFFTMCAGALRACPKALSYPESVIRSEIHETWCDYFIEHAQSQSLVARVRSWLVAFTARRVVFEEFQSQKRALTIQLAELEQAHHQTKQALELMTRFLTTVTHELRTPLSGIIGLGEILKSSDLTPDDRRLLAGDVIRSAATVLRLVDSVVDFDTAAVRQQKREVIDLRAQISALASAFEPAARAKGLEVAATVAENLPQRVELDPTLLSKTIAAILDNAVRFTETGGIELSVERALERDVLRVKVTDTGCGIAATVLPQIFDPFVQGDSRMSRRVGGIGLGLSVVRRIAESCGGTVSCTSTWGQGSTFTIEWPFSLPTSVDAPLSAPVEVPRATVLSLPPPPPVVREQGTRRMRALIAEDNKINQKILSRMLNNLDVDTDVAENGVQALEAHAKRSYDVIFMDLQMPELDGFEATQEIRRREGDRRHTPIFAVTANHDDANRVRAADVGMDGFLSKPVVRESVAGILHRIGPEPAPRVSIVPSAIVPGRAAEPPAARVIRASLSVGEL